MQAWHSHCYFSDDYALGFIIMDIQTGAIQSYQKNQNIAGWVQETAASQQVAGIDPNDQAVEDDSVIISNQRDVYDWMSNTLPLSLDNQANVSRLSQTFYQYQILNFEDLNAVNTLMNEHPNQDLLTTLHSEKTETLSFAAKQQLNHLDQVFSTLKAAQSFNVA
jgi:hypothetical protein